MGFFFIYGASGKVVVLMSFSRVGSASSCWIQDTLLHSVSAGRAKTPGCCFFTTDWLTVVPPSVLHWEPYAAVSTACVFSVSLSPVIHSHMWASVTTDYFISRVLWVIWEKSQSSVAQYFKIDICYETTPKTGRTAEKYRSRSHDSYCLIWTVHQFTALFIYMQYKYIFA